ncbi:transcriptional regulator [Kitasatospora sp. NPDC057198]|uniref:transcriptional regulator n=1 Tax=Kitasatospora sp. NPDC057198 TaxID=3346046 RepID=UPI00363F0746
MRVPTMEAETSAPPTSARHLRLAECLADPLPGAAAVQVGLVSPRRQCPHPWAVAVDAGGRQMPLGRTTSQVVARWVVRTWPDVDWTGLHTLDLATGRLTVGVGTAARGR